LSPGRVIPKTNIAVFSFSAMYTDLRRKRKEWLAWNLDKVSRVEQHVYL
jgi:hypothetical protein